MSYDKYYMYEIDMHILISKKNDFFLIHYVLHVGNIRANEEWYDS